MLPWTLGNDMENMCKMDLSNQHTSHLRYKVLTVMKMRNYLLDLQLLKPIIKPIRNCPIFLFAHTVRCLPDWEEGPNDRCYKFVPEFETFTDARLKCQSLAQDGDLVIIQTSEENEYIMNVTKGGDWWIGKSSCRIWWIAESEMMTSNAWLLATTYSMMTVHSC